MAYRLNAPFATVLALLALFACKPVPQNMSEVVAVGDEDCGGILTEEREIALVTALAQYNRDFFAGRSTLAKRDEQTRALVVAYAGGNLQREGAVKAVVSRAAELIGSSYVMSSVFKTLSGVALSASDKQILASFGIPDDAVDDYLADVAAPFSTYHQALTKIGATYDAAKGWDFTDAELTVETLEQSPAVMTAIALFLSADIASQLRDGDRTESVVGEHFVFLPPTAEGKLNTSTRAEWERDVKNELARLARETEAFIKATKAASTYSNLMKGRIIQWFGGERGHEGKTAPEIEAESTYKGMLYALKRLSTTLGVGQKQHAALLKVMAEANAIEAENLKQGLAKLDLATKAAIAAPFIPLIIYAAPFAGGLIGPTFATVVSNASATMALLPMAFGVGNAAISAGIKASQLGGDFRCHMYEEFAVKGAGGLYAAPFAAAIPVAVATGSAGVAAVAGGGAVTAATTYGVINLGLAAKGLHLTSTSAYTGFKTCHAELKKAEAAGEAGNEQAVNALATKAYDACAKAGIDLGFAVVAAGHLSKTAYQRIQSGDVLGIGEARQALAGPSQGFCLDGEACGVPAPKPKEELAEGQPNAPPAAGKVLMPPPPESKYFSDFVAKQYYKGDAQQLSPPEAQALQGYAKQDFKVLNETLTTGATPPPALAQQIQLMDSAIAKAKPMPEGIMIFRGQLTRDPAGVPAVGAEITRPAFTSTSIDTKVAGRFIQTNVAKLSPGDPTVPTAILSKIKIPAGNKVAGFYMEPLPGVYHGEQEILLPRNAKFKVISSTPSETYYAGRKVNLITQVLELLQ